MRAVLAVPNPSCNAYHPSAMLQYLLVTRFAALLVSDAAVDHLFVLPL